MNHRASGKPPVTRWKSGRQLWTDLDGSRSCTGHDPQRGTQVCQPIGVTSTDHLGLDVGVETDSHGMRADRPDRLAQGNAPAVDDSAGLRFDGLGEVGGRDRAEKPAL